MPIDALLCRLKLFPLARLRNDEERADLDLELAKLHQKIKNGENVIAARRKNSG